MSVKWRRSGPGGAGCVLGVILACLLCHGVVCGQSVQAGRVRIAETAWGFDGRVTAGEFQPVSLLLDNLSADPVEGLLTLQMVSGVLRRSGAVYEQSVFLGPSARRWVQFYPWISDPNATWQLELRTSAGVIPFDALDQPRLVEEENLLQSAEQRRLPVVLLDRAGSLERIPTTVKHMSEEVFPPYSTATHGLHGLFLDHVPDWEEPRQTALLSWLQRGGQLHLLLDSNGQRLRFSGLLAVLNEPFETFAVGAGQVVRHELQRAGLTESLVSGVMFPPRAEEAEQGSRGQLQPGDLRLRDDEGILERLRKTSEPEHSSVLIGFLALLYVLVLYPGVWWFSNQPEVKFPWPLAAIAGAVVLFSLLFLWVGRRGYQEVRSCRADLVAVAEDGRHWDVLAFRQLFVTEGADYSLGQSGCQTLLASGVQDEQVAATAVVGAEAAYRCRIPPYSRELVISRSRVELGDFGLRLSQFSVTGGNLTGLVIAAGAGLQVREGDEAWVVYKSEVWPLVWSAGERQFRLRPAGRSSVGNFLRDQYDGFAMPWGGLLPGGVVAGPAGSGGALGETLTEEQLKRRERTRGLFRRALWRPGRGRVGDVQIPADRVLFLLETELSDELQVVLDPELEQVGRVMFAKELRPGDGDVAAEGSAIGNP